MAGSRDFDPLAYIEGAFLDRNPSGAEKAGREPKAKAPKGSVRFRKTALSAPRPRRAGSTADQPAIDPELQDVLLRLPKNIDFLGRFYADDVTAHYYNHGFRETRQELIQRLLDPELSLEETSRLLGVCPATVRRYTNRGWLQHHRTKGGQRRFRLSNLVRFVESHGRTPAE